MPSIQEQIIAAAYRWGVDPEIALAVAERESGFNPNAVGDRGRAVGVFQLHAGAAQDMGVDRFTLAGNIEGGVRYLAAQYQRFGSWDLALAAYNAGASNVAAGGRYAESILASLGWPWGGGYLEPSYLAGDSAGASPAPALESSAGLLIGLGLGLVGLVFLASD